MATIRHSRGSDRRAHHVSFETAKVGDAQLGGEQSRQALPAYLFIRDDPGKERIISKGTAEQRRRRAGVAQHGRADDPSHATNSNVRLTNREESRR